MKIAIDCRWIFPKISGIGSYTESLVKGLNSIDTENEYFCITNNSNKEDKHNISPHQLLRSHSKNGYKEEYSGNWCGDIVVPYGIYSITNQIRLPKLLKKLGVDVFHSPNFMIPFFVPKKIKVILTVHDIIPWKFPEYTPQAKKTKYYGLFKWVIKKCLNRADKVIVVSNTTADDLMECLDVKREKISVVYNGLNSMYFEAKKTKQPEYIDYILFVGRADPYKNMEGLIRAYAKLIKDKNIRNKLLIVGEKDKRYPNVYSLVDDLGVSDNVVFYGYADKDELVQLYKNAFLFVLPSLYEGFGLPPLEAMASGVPVIVSNAPAILEVVGDNAIVVDSKDIDALTQAMSKVIADRNSYNDMVNNAKEYAKGFTIEKMAKETLEVYKG